MDDQDRVFARYPEAQAVEEPSIFKHGDASPIQRSHWEVYAGPEPDAALLGSGRTEDRAWADAARKLRAALREAG